MPTAAAAAARAVTNITKGTQRGTSAGAPSPLAGRVLDESGEPLVATHACKGSVRYRYYVSHALQQQVGQAEGDGIRMAAMVALRLGSLCSPLRPRKALNCALPDA